MNQKLIDQVGQLLIQRGKAELLSGVLANDEIERQAKMRAEMTARENAAAANAAGWPEVGAKDDMGHILGDVNISQPGQNGGNKMLPLLLAGMMGAGLPAAGLLGWYLASKPNESPPATAPVDTDTNTVIGLGKVEDYLSKDAE